MFIRKLFAVLTLLTIYSNAYAGLSTARLYRNNILLKIEAAKELVQKFKSFKSKPDASAPIQVEELEARISRHELEKLPEIKWQKDSAQFEAAKKQISINFINRTIHIDNKTIAIPELSGDELRKFVEAELMKAFVSQTTSVFTNLFISEAHAELTTAGLLLIAAVIAAIIDIVYTGYDSIACNVKFAKFKRTYQNRLETCEAELARIQNGELTAENSETMRDIEEERASSQRYENIIEELGVNINSCSYYIHESFLRWTFFANFSCITIQEAEDLCNSADKLAACVDQL